MLPPGPTTVLPGRQETLRTFDCKLLHKMRRRKDESIRRLEREIDDEPLHGYAIAFAIQNATDDAPCLEEGSLYPALYRMEEKGWERFVDAVRKVIAPA
jgi:DNA-binding PadR family transcriptional regulator